MKKKLLLCSLFMMAIYLHALPQGGHMFSLVYNGHLKNKTIEVYVSENDYSGSRFYIVTTDINTQKISKYSALYDSASKTLRFYNVAVENTFSSGYFLLDQQFSALESGPTKIYVKYITLGFEGKIVLTKKRDL